MKQWRFVFTGANDAFFNMALDEALLLSCEKGVSPPILRLYQWEPPAISIGYSQSVEKTVDLKKCRDKHIPVVRRITGGRAVLHEDELTYSMCASSDDFPELGEDVNQTYQRLSLAWVESLHVLGIDAEWVKPSFDTLGCSGGGLILRASPCFDIPPLAGDEVQDKHPARSGQPSNVTQSLSKPCFLSHSRYEITVNGKKLIGSAQRRFSYRSAQGERSSFIQHGSILIGKGRYSLADFLPEESSKKIMKQLLKEKSTSLEEVLNRRVEIEEMIFALKKSFGKLFDIQIEDSPISEAELKRACALREEKYLSAEWNLRR